MLPYSDSRLTRVALGIFFVVLLGYGFFEAQGILFGPRISISSSTAEVSDPYVRIEGHAEHIASLSMNGRQISVTEQGAFNEPYLLAPGSNRILLEAKDKYGNRSQRTLEIVYTATSTSSWVATTTAPAGTASSTAGIAPGN